MEQQIDYAERAALLKALAHPLRLQLLHGLLHTGCHNVGCMEHLTGVSQSCISQHLQKLPDDGSGERGALRQRGLLPGVLAGGGRPGSGIDERGGIQLCPMTYW